MSSSPEILKFFADFICKELGIVYHEANAYQLETRLAEVAKQFGFPGIAELHRETQTRMSPALRLMLLDVATNNETSFFRDPPVFEAIENVVLKEFVAGGPSTPLRVWSAACSYGQEPYSLAMLFERHATELPFGYKILATDVSERALAAAERGLYSQLQVQRGLQAGLLVKHFQKAEGSSATLDWEVKPELKRSLSFRKQNLLADFRTLGQFDLILCRNVLIYQSVERKRDVISRLAERLSPKGILILGAAESMLGISDDFELVRAGRAMLYRPKGRYSRSA